MKTYSTAVTIERPNGKIETTTKSGNLIHLKAQITKATADAGRGKVLSVRLVTANARYEGCRYYTRDQGCPMHGETCT